MRVSRLCDIGIVMNEAASDNSFMKETFDYTLQSFNNGFQSKFIGFIVGNFLAGIAVKIVADFLQNTALKFQDNKQAVTPPPSPKVTIMPSSWAILALCVLIDSIGDSSYTIPGVGELEDVVWAPISAFALSKIFGSTAITTLDFLKEALPGTDVLPVASIAWLLQNFYPYSPLTKILGIDPPPQVLESSSANDDTRKSKTD